MRLKLLQAVLGAAVSAAVIIWLILAVEWGEVWRSLLSADYWLLVPITLIIIVQFVLRAWRWRYLLPDSEDTPTPVLFDGIMFGNLGNYILPLRAGEFMRPAFLMRQSRHSFSTGLVSVVIERFFDLAMVLFMFGGVLLFLEGMPQVVYQGAAALSCLAVCLFLFIVAAGLFPQKLMHRADWALAFFPAKARGVLTSFLHDFLAGSAVFKQRRVLPTVVLLTLSIWLVTIAQYYLALHMFPVEASLLFGTTITVILALGVAAPSAPGFIGPFQAAIVIAFALFGESKELGTAYAVVSHVQQYLMVVGLGVLVILKYGLRLGEFRQATPSKLAS